MKLNQLNLKAHLIEPQDSGALRVNGCLHERSIWFDHEHVQPWRPKAHRDIQLGDFAPIIALKPDVLLVGTGLHQHFLPPAVRAQIEQAGIGVEVMSTRAAIRSYLIMQSDQRSVITALII
mgnify:CR=1 FL=1